MDDSESQELIVLDTFEPAVAFDPAHRDEARRRFSIFLVEADAGEGGTGFVQRASNTAGEVFAIKRLRSINTQDERIAAGMRAVLFEEYKNQLTVSHLKGFPRVYGYGTCGGEPLIVMEWVNGSTLKKITPELPHEGEGVRGDAVAAIGVAVLSILNSVRHLDVGLAHRDISPRNIMIATDERPLAEQIASLDFDVRLIDFGSSTALNPVDPTFTTRADVWRGGTPEYAPPEMLTHDIAGIEGKRLSPSVDIYALSSVLYELYCGRTPFNLKALGTASPYRVKTETAFAMPYPRTEADGALVKIIASGLSVDQNARPTVEQMLDALRRWQSSELGDWPTPEPHWGSDMPAPGSLVGPGASMAEPVPATFDTAMPVFFPLSGDEPSDGSPAPAGAESADAGADATAPGNTAPAGAGWNAPAAPSSAKAPAGTAAAPGGNTAPVPQQDTAEPVFMPVPTVVGAPRVAYDPTAPNAPAAASPAGNAVFGGAAAGGAPAPGASAGMSPAPSPIYNRMPPQRPYTPAQAATAQAGAPGSGALSGSMPPYATGQASAAADAAKAATSVSRRAFIAAGGLAAVAAAGGVVYTALQALGSGSDGSAGSSKGSAKRSENTSADTGSSSSSSEDSSSKTASASSSSSSKNTISVEMRFAAQQNGKWGLIDSSGAWKVKPTYSDMRLYGAGYAAALDAKTGLWGYLDQDGSWAIEPAFSDTHPFNDYGAVAQDAETEFWGVLDRDGKWLVDPTYYDMGDTILGNLVPCRSSNEEASWSYLYLKTGKRSDVPPKFRAIGGWDSANGLGPATEDGTAWGYINGYGQWKIEPQFKAARRFSSNRAAVQLDDGTWGYILPDGTRAFSTTFAEAHEFANGWAPVKDPATGLWGCSTVSGAWQLEPKFRAVGDIFTASTAALLPVQDNDSGKWGVVDDAGDWRVKPRFDRLI